MNLQTIKPLIQNQTLVIALSGGLDSVVMLHYLYHHKPKKTLRVVHINHHLSTQSNSWAKFCQSLSQQYHLNYQVFNVFLNTDKNLEKNARDKRYQTLFSNLANNEILCTAHHQSDQAETILLQLFRGCGVAGLASMPKFKYPHYRPLLSWSKQDILNYAKEHNLSWIEDNSNTNINFRRNFLRIDIIPQLKKVFLGLEKTLSRSATHQAQTLQLLSDLAQIDIKQNQLLSANHRLKIKKICQLKPSRFINVLRYILAQQKIPSPNQARLQEIYQQLIHIRIDANICIAWQNYELRVYQNEIYFIKSNQVKFNCALTQHLKTQAGVEIGYHQDIKRVILKNKRHSQSLKKLYQEKKIPPWIRQKLAKYYQNNQLIAIEGLGYCQIPKSQLPLAPPDLCTN